MRLLGIDPGLANLGLAVVELQERGAVLLHAEVVRTKRESGKRRTLVAEDDARRAETLWRRILAVGREHDVDAFAVEAPGGSRNAGTAKALGLSVGVIASAAATLGVPLLMETVNEIKVGAAGKRTASKAEVAKAVSEVVGQDVPKKERADAVAAALVVSEKPMLRALREAWA